MTVIPDPARGRTARAERHDVRVVEWAGRAAGSRARRDRALAERSNVQTDSVTYAVFADQAAVDVVRATPEITGPYGGHAVALASGRVATDGRVMHAHRWPEAAKHWLEAQGVQVLDAPPADWEDADVPDRGIPT